jgi:hypothetical protein
MRAITTLVERLLYSILLLPTLLCKHLHPAHIQFTSIEPQGHNLTCLSLVHPLAHICLHLGACVRTHSLILAIMERTMLCRIHALVVLLMQRSWQQQLNIMIQPHFRKQWIWTSQMNGMMHTNMKWTC